MAGFRLRNNKWQARIQRNGYPDVAKSFDNKSDAIKWATKIEAEMNRGSYINTSLAERTTFSELILRYLQEVTPKTKSAKEDGFRLRALAKSLLRNTA